MSMVDAQEEEVDSFYEAFSCRVHHRLIKTVDFEL